MESRPSGPVVLTAEEQAVLNEGIGLILSRWTAMRAAVENCWGGRDSQAKAERTVSNVLHFFIQSKDLTDFEGLADILESGLLELNTVSDDVVEVTEKLLVLYYECLEGKNQTLENLRATKSQTRASVVKVTNGNNEEDEESDDEEDEEDTDMNNDQSTDMMMVDASEQCSNQKPEAMPVGDDGWTLVPSRKNKGKRN